MSFPPCPGPPGWTIDWPALDALSWLQETRNCPQDPVRHAEGDVWTHVHMVCAAMAADPCWRELPGPERELLFAAALLHDVAKPQCVRVHEDGAVSSRGHAWKGAIRARYILWRRGVPFGEREQVAALVRHHLVPFYLGENRDPHRLAIEVSQTARCDHLAILARADARGRTCPDPDRLLARVGEFESICAEAGCLRVPYAFPTDHARFLYFRDPRRRPEDAAGGPSGSEVTLLCGLPGAGKDFWVARHGPAAPVIALDEVRENLGVLPGGSQAEVVTHARELARQKLRAGEPFVWNATNINRHIRGECVGLFAEYNARVRIVYLEVPYARLIWQNRARRRSVPMRVMERFFDRWEVPDRAEAHQVDFLVEDGDEPD